MLIESYNLICTCNWFLAHLSSATPVRLLNFLHFRILIQNNWPGLILTTLKQSILDYKGVQICSNEGVNPPPLKLVAIIFFTNASLYTCIKHTLLKHDCKGLWYTLTPRIRGRSQFGCVCPIYTYNTINFFGGKREFH